MDPNTIFSTDCTTGTSEEREKVSLSVYPNPTTGGLTVGFGATYSKVTVEVRDVIGKTILRKTYTNTNQLDLEIEDSSGLYFMQVSMGNREASIVRVVKQ